MIDLNPQLWSKVERQQQLAVSHVVPDPKRCMQCGICSYNCPVGIDVRGHAWRGQPIDDSYCLTCAQCILRCPRRALSFQPIETPTTNPA